jgi:cell wall-associated NlpC family hydrolase
MSCIRLTYILPLLMLCIGCSGVKVALSNADTRIEYAEKGKSNYLKSESGKVYALRNSMVTTADHYIGTPYKYASIDPSQGFDCSGLVYTVGKKNNLDLPRSSSSMANGVPHIDWKKCETGDLVFFGERGRIHHVGLVEKNKRDELYIIHSTNQQGVIRENVLASSYWKKRLLFAVDITAYQKNKAKA